MKSIQKQKLEDIVIHTIQSMLDNEERIKFLAKGIYDYHQKQTKENTTLKLLEQQKKQAEKSSQNILKAIEQGIITDMTKTRLQELESQIATLDIEIQKEKYRDYSLLTLDMIENYLRKQVFENADDIKIRKLLINTFVREVRLYEDKVIILLNFIPPIGKPKLTVEENQETERQITSALSNPHSSCIYPYSAPNYHPLMGDFLLSINS